MIMDKLLLLKFITKHIKSKQEPFQSEEFDRTKQQARENYAHGIPQKIPLKNFP